MRSVNGRGVRDSNPWPRRRTVESPRPEAILQPGRTADPRSRPRRTACPDDDDRAPARLPDPDLAALPRADAAPARRSGRRDGELPLPGRARG